MPALLAPLSRLVLAVRIARTASEGSIAPHSLYEDADLADRALLLMDWLATERSQLYGPLPKQLSEER